MCAHMRACVHACMRACMHECVQVCGGAFVSAHMLVYVCKEGLACLVSCDLLFLSLLFFVFCFSCLNVYLVYN